MTAVTDYPALVARCVELIGSTVEPSSRVAVVSRGDAALTRVGGRTVEQFPCDADGRWLGYHPADGVHALQLLQDAIGRGATHLFLPVTASWWLDHYGELDQWLGCHATVVVDEAATGRLYALPQGPQPAEAAPVDTALPTWRPEDAVRSRVGQEARHLREIAGALAGPTASVLVAGLDPERDGTATHLAVPHSLDRLDPTAARLARARGEAGWLLVDRAGIGSLYLVPHPGRSR